ncbi:MAG: hypothetical protein NWQ45_13665, partial [Congregibacter sp.]|nr:hypothetical protein [Congregibacter sp.]
FGPTNPLILQRVIKLVQIAQFAVATGGLLKAWRAAVAQNDSLGAGSIGYVEHRSRAADDRNLHGAGWTVRHHQSESQQAE